MNTRISLDDAVRILADAGPKQCFWVNNGPVLRNIHEMASAIENMKDDTFRHHLHEGKNDFANWIRDVLRDDELAASIADAGMKEKVLRMIKKRINFLENIINEANSSRMG